MPIVVKAQPQTQIEMQTQAAAANPFHSKQERGKALRQVVAAFIANLGTINTGLVFGFSAVVIPQLKQSDSIIQIDESQASWIGEFHFYVNLQIKNEIAIYKSLVSTKTIKFDSINILHRND